ncbi:AbgT family transporter [Novosphingobium sp. G106]|nr:AbgT family transporter [Novosphingobium sp. G106]
MATSSSGEARRVGWRERFLDKVERLGNALPDPVALFAGIVVLLMAVSALGAAQGWSATNPVTGEILVAKSLLSEASIRQFFTEMPKTYTGFPPLGLVLVLMLGAGVAEQSGLITALLRRLTARIPPRCWRP